MNCLEKYYNKFIKYDLILKFNYKNIKKIPKIKSIILNFGSIGFFNKAIPPTFVLKKKTLGKN